MVEAGHRCAIPTCRVPTPLQIDHIIEWSRVKKHEFSNMIVLCANCHARKGNRRGQIDRKSLQQYKANLAIVNARYGEYERRILDFFALAIPVVGEIDNIRAIESKYADLQADFVAEGREIPVSDAEKFERLPQVRASIEKFASILWTVQVSAGLHFSLMYLIRDGYLRRVDGHPGEVSLDGKTLVSVYELTESGRQFLWRWRSAKPID
jgi:hypothetical protein